MSACLAQNEAGLACRLETGHLGYHNALQSGAERSAAAVVWHDDHCPNGKEETVTIKREPVNPPIVNPLKHELEEWWRGMAEKEISAVVPKATEYGAGDLVEIGRNLMEAGRIRVPEGREEKEFQAELGIYFYVVGKLARWTSAIQEGRAVSDDTLHDIGVYARMAQRVRQSGGWPS